ncbi:MAG TPA: hypothetical protein VK691_11820 [Solirubrobacteraceae bacterium]|nr:hypothetical protein [Solirubrobacteraceae bacterium]
MAHLYFLAIVLGFPLVYLLLALVGGYLYRGRDAELLDWKPTRSPQREAELATNDIDQMRSCLHDLRHRRGADNNI